MEYSEAANYLFDLRRFRPKPGTETTAALLAHLEDPQAGLQCVQIAGSNGKGSTARMLERVLREAGVSVGLYTSPHLEDVRERIRVDGRKIPRQELQTFVETCQPYLTERSAVGESPTFFETMTALALWHFERAAVDVAVLEVGIGGRYDATSVVDPIASAVTSVSLEHTEVIGETVEEIARDKAQVAPIGRPLVVGLSGAAREAAADVAESILVVGTGEDTDVRVTDRGRTDRGETAIAIAGDGWAVETTIPLVGAHQAENAGIAVTLARQVMESTATTLSQPALERGLRKAHWPGRFEIMDRTPLTVLDGAHNPAACEQLAKTLSTFEFEALHLVFGAMHDKDHEEMAAALPTPDSVWTCQPDLDRAADGSVLETVFGRAGGSISTVTATESVDDAFASALETATADDCILVTGSLFTVAEARETYTHRSIPAWIRTLDDAEATLTTAAVSSQERERHRRDLLTHVISTRLRASQASRLQRACLEVGATCALSGHRHDGEHATAVLEGTNTQFDQLCRRLREQAGFGTVARGIKAQVEQAAGAEANKDSASAAEPYPWTTGTAVMGILNVTPDSFHDGGEYTALEAAVTRAEEMVEAGADVIDIGGESTRPGADPVGVEAEIERVVPVIEAIDSSEWGHEALVSVDTRKAAVAEAALEAGADMLNDVSGLEDPEMRYLAAEYDVPIVVMDSVETPVNPDREVTYDDVVTDVIDQLSERVLLAKKAGLTREQIVVDPGIGFGKRAVESFELLERVGEFDALGCPVLVGHSHKSMFGHIDCGPEDRGAPTVAATALAADRGADIVRVHDVPENVAAVKTALAVRDR